jgi:CBS domain-containing protein
LFEVGSKNRKTKELIMMVRECMTKTVDLIHPNLTLTDAAKKMRDGDYGVLPVGEKDRLVGMITDRDIAIRAVAEGADPKNTPVREVMSTRVLYCYDDQTLDEVSKNMGDNQIRRLPVLNREKRLVGILSLGDVALSEIEEAEEALVKISEPVNPRVQAQHS